MSGGKTGRPCIIMMTPHQTANAPQWVRIDGGIFTMGNDHPDHGEDGEQPARPVELKPYQLSAATITNAMFAQFAAQTGYTTHAERQGFSHVFKGQLEAPDEHPEASAIAPWWRLVKGASWQFPNGSLACDDALPAVHIAHEDALQYCAWAGCRLPTEAEWEYAAQQGEGIKPHVWRGTFPDRHADTPQPKPVLDGEANGFGLYHMCGNVWEWTADRFTRLHSPRLTHNPTGPLNGRDRVVKGGSFLCCPSYCARFKPYSRRAETPTATTSHLGFRVAMDG